ncbi:MAG TPA: zinc ABC transporter permease subunit ZnuB [Pseudomonadales bacterium]|nr:zinc ABC transporter permease subunit ZnuB [Pseudomonadales bacterium]
MLELLLPALLGGIGVALVAGPLGSFLVWRRMAYFGDTLSHAALLGVALGAAWQINLHASVLAVCLGLAILLVWLQQQRIIASDTLLGILAHSSLSLGLVTVALLPGTRLDLMAYLFGDLLTVSSTDLVWIWLGVVASLIIVRVIWNSLLAITLHEELAEVEGVPVLRVRLVLMLLVATVIAIAMKIVGVLLITALMIIPAATARRFSRTPEQMACFASLLGALAVSCGIGLSFWKDTPVGPSIVVASMLGFLLVYAVPRRTESTL